MSPYIKHLIQNMYFLLILTFVSQSYACCWKSTSAVYCDDENIPALAHNNTAQQLKEKSITKTTFETSYVQSKDEKQSLYSLKLKKVTVLSVLAESNIKPLSIKQLEVDYAIEDHFFTYTPDHIHAHLPIFMHIKELILNNCINIKNIFIIELENLQDLSHITLHNIFMQDGLYNAGFKMSYFDDIFKISHIRSLTISTVDPLEGCNIKALERAAHKYKKKFTYLGYV